MKKILAIALSALLTSPSSFAGNITVATKSTATLTSSCSISAQDLSFGLFVPATTGNVDSSAAVVSTCSKGVTYSIQMNGYSAYCNNRYMSSTSGNGSVLYYNVLYRCCQNSHLDLWLLARRWFKLFSYIRRKLSHLDRYGSCANNPVYGRMSANQFVPPGSYVGGVAVALTSEKTKSTLRC